MKKMTTIFFLLLLSGISVFAQRDSNRNDWRIEQNNESSYSRSDIIRCYKTTNSLASFINCLEPSCQRFSRDRGEFHECIKAQREREFLSDPRRILSRDGKATGRERDIDWKND